MNEIISKAALEARRIMFPSGSRVELVSMNDKYTRLKPGDRGTVEHVDDIGTVGILWDCGSSLGAAYGEDIIKPLPPQITDDIREQIMAIRDSGETNMMDYIAVQRIAFEKYFYELVDFIETSVKAYSHFILTGEEL